MTDSWPTFVCPGCGEEKPLEFATAIYSPDHVETVPLTNCAECRAKFLADLKEGKI
jgi:hypothetical protein